MTPLRGRRRARGHTRASGLCGLLVLPLACGFPHEADASAQLTEFHPLFSWSTPGERIGRGGFQIVELHDNGDLALLVAADSTDTPFGEPGHWYLLDLTGGDLRQKATSFEIPGRLQYVSIFSSGSAREFIAITRSAVEVFSGPDWNHSASIDLPTIDATAGVVADLLPAPGPELAVCDHDNLYLLSYPSGAYLSTRFGFGCRALQVGQADSDPDLELLLMGRELGLVVVGGPLLAVEWSDIEGRATQGLFIDADSDGQDEVLYGLEVYDYDVEVAFGLRLSDPRTNSIIWQVPDLAVGHLSAGDVDQDPELEVLLPYDGDVLVLDSLTGAPGPDLPPIPGSVRRVVTADLDGSGTSELVAVAEGLAPWWMDQLVAIDLASGALLGAFPPVSGPFDSASIVDIDANGRPELVTVATEGPRYTGSYRLLFLDYTDGRVVYLEDVAWNEPSPTRASAVAQIDGDLQLEVCTFRGGASSIGIRCEDALTHGVQWETPLPETVVGVTLAVADLDGDDSPEIVGTTEFGGAMALDGLTGTLLWFDSLLEGPESSGSRLRVANLDNDSGLEVLVGGRYGPPSIGAFVVLDGVTGTVDFGPFELDGAVFEPMQLDSGPLEVVAARPDGSIAQVDLSTGNLGPTLATFAAPVHSLRAADLTRDGVVDLVGFSTDRLRVIDGELGQEIWSSGFLGLRSGYPDGLWIFESGPDRPPVILADTFVGFIAIEAPLFSIFEDGFESGGTLEWSRVEL